MSVHDPTKMSKLARERFSVALMSDTKWRKLFSAVGHLSSGPMIVKFIDVEEPRQMRFPPSFACPMAFMDTLEFGPVELRAIEWLELPIDLEPIVDPIGKFPLQQTDFGTRVIGYQH
ncbi:MAG: hypothetical protein AAF494_01345 [Pseudomonadota bacterium]